MYDIQLLSLSHQRPIAIYYVLSSNPLEAKSIFNVSITLRTKWSSIDEYYIPVRVSRYTGIEIATCGNVWKLLRRDSESPRGSREGAFSVPMSFELPGRLMFAFTSRQASIV